MSYTVKPNLRKIDASEVAQGVNGEAAYVMVRTRLKGIVTQNYQKAILSLNALIGMSENGHAGEVDLSTLPQQVDDFTDKVFEAYGAFIVKWNWLDDETGRPLPEPTKEVIETQLYTDQVEWIRDRFREFLEYRATEGNVRSSSAS